VGLVTLWFEIRFEGFWALEMMILEGLDGDFILEVFL